MNNTNSKKGNNTRYLTLNVYKNCFNDGESTHLGVCFKGIYYCITHSKSKDGEEIPKKYLKMKDISDKPEFLKKCSTVPTFVNKTSLKIHQGFLINYHLKYLFNK